MIISSAGEILFFTAIGENLDWSGNYLIRRIFNPNEVKMDLHDAAAARIVANCGFTPANGVLHLVREIKKILGNASNSIKWTVKCKLSL